MLSTFEEKVQFVKQHYEGKGYRVHSGLQFGAELVLYADRPDLVHSDFCIHVTRDGKCATNVDRSFIPADAFRSNLVQRV
jgi:tRNA splicing endonuclease